MFCNTRNYHVKKVETPRGGLLRLAKLVHCTCMFEQAWFEVTNRNN